MKLLGFEIETEILTCDGRIDAVIKTENYIYVIEFKLGSAQEALQQIKKKQYALKYKTEQKEIVLMAIEFDVEKKNIGEYLLERDQ
ncbi:MAG: PD-(D/E)XK nuclease domain-containing protein [Bacteroidetes bacterium]|nr:PD-(D/E)XK nuclease domain-containing protein [Bacteroidota bacterium]